MRFIYSVTPIVIGVISHLNLYFSSLAKNCGRLRHFDVKKMFFQAMSFFLTLKKPFKEDVLKFGNTIILTIQSKKVWYPSGDKRKV
tara:strand:+ start:702 stop:959 length:258 start_codon:yes stop_codon:yes gene_type:complete